MPLGKCRSMCEPASNAGNTDPCAGIDQQPYHVGVQSAELLIAQIRHNTYGIPTLPCNTTVPSRWVDGPTLKACATQPGAGLRALGSALPTSRTTGRLGETPGR